MKNAYRRHEADSNSETRVEHPSTVPNGISVDIKNTQSAIEQTVRILGRKPISAKELAEAVDVTTDAILLPDSEGTASDETEEAIYDELSQLAHEIQRMEDKVKPSFEEPVEFVNVLTTRRHSLEPFFRFIETFKQKNGDLLRLQEITIQHLGPIYGSLILESGYLERAARMEEFLRTQKIQTIPLFQEALSVAELVSICEIFQTPERLSTLLQSISAFEQTGLELTAKTPLLKINTTSFNRSSGEAHAQVTLDFWLQDPVKTKRNARITREFRFTNREDSTGERERFTNVNYDYFVLPDDLQKQGVAKKTLQQSVAWYLEQKTHGTEVRNMELHANIDVGGYAWACYGFGWNEEQMSAALAKELHTSGRITPENPKELWEQAQTNFVEQLLPFAQWALEEAEDASALSNEERDSYSQIRKELDDIRSDLTSAQCRTLVTPQRLANVGKSGPFFIQESGQWKIARDPGSRKKMHIGKILLLGSSWRGRLPLTPSNADERARLNLLKQRLDLSHET